MKQYIIIVYTKSGVKYVKDYDLIKSPVVILCDNITHAQRYDENIVMGYLPFLRSNFPSTGFNIESI